MIARNMLMFLLVIVLTGAPRLDGELIEAVYSNGDSILKVSVERIDVLFKSQIETLSFPGLIEFAGKLIVPHHRSKPGEKGYRNVAAVSTDGGKTWTDLPSDSPFCDDLENSGLYGYTRDGAFLYVDTFPMEVKKNPEEWGPGGYYKTQRTKNPTWRVRRFSRASELKDTWKMRMLDLPWQEASYENYGSILELENGDLLTAFQCLVEPPKEEGGKTLYNFSSFIARSTDRGKSFKHIWTFGPVIDGKRIRGDEGLVEPDMALLPNGDILCIMRTDSYSPMYQSRSKDGGRTWSQPASVGWPGVKPKLRVLKNGVLACTSGRGLYGRPQVTYAMFSIDGTGEVWETPFSFYTGLSDNYTFNMERDGKLYVVYSVLSATNPPYQFAYTLPFESIRWAVLRVTKEKRT
jgi:hypothetical protein